ncbi:PAS domain S-box-containing protein [Anaerosolibacter carboniphilus]|uniref:PAS domain S-box-containing protein n=1 Tax=Anaerosolibacter carboniphilus TaxID=1417629 RepID=A0A841L2H5_9FIRM|nr:HD domain-containing phosphohydrolase [Anaerosolibacter carboniphilus]MBB6218828.1 PAS domain S-box-containing protein [Anaerosolibacter carboniphilus]
MFKRNYRLRLIAVFLVITSIPLLFMGVMMQMGFQNYIMDLYNGKIMHQLDSQINMTDQWFQNKIQNLKTVGQAVTLLEDKSLGLEELNKYLENQRKHVPEFFNIFITLENGLSPAALESKPGIDFRERPWYVKAKEKSATIISQPYDDIITGTEVITISLPIWDQQGKFMGVIGGDLDLTSMKNMVRYINITDKSTQFVLDGQGKILWEDLHGRDKATIDSRDLEKLKNGKGSFLQIDQNGRPMIATYVDLPTVGWQIAVFSDMADYYGYVNRIKYIFYGLAAATMGIMILSAFIASKQISKPMIELKTAVQGVSMGKFDIHIERKYHDEIGEVIDAFNQMSATIHQNYQDLTQQAVQLMDGNQQLQDMNIQLELSYEQLQEMNMELEASFEQLQATSEQLNHSEQKYRLLIANITDLVWTIDEDGNTTYINDSVGDILGYKKEDILGKPIESILCPYHDYENCSDIIGALKEKDFNNLDLWMLAKDQEKRHIIETTTRRLFHEGRFVGVQGVGRDVTEYVKMKQEIINRNKELTVFNELSYALTNSISNLKMDVLLSNIVSKVVELMEDVAICTIRLLENDKELVLKACTGPLAHMITQEAILVDQDGMGMAVKKKRVLSLKELEDGYISSYNQHILDTKKVNDVVFVPLMIKDNVIGIMTVSSETKIEESHIHILSALSNHAAVAIEKARLYDQLKEAYFKTIKALVIAIEAKDTYTQGHSARVAHYATLIGKHLGLTDAALDDLQVAGILHDVGKIGIKETILTKPGKLDEDEFKQIMEHPSIGNRILEPIGLPKEIMDAVLLHHKRYDVQGYPHNIQVSELPIFAEIIGVADALDAMLSKRSYRQPMSIEEGIAELKRCSGTQFSPKIVDVMENIYQTNVHAIREIAGA